MTLKVLHLLPDDHSVSPVIHSLVKGLAERDVQQLVCCLQGSGDYAGPLAAAGVRVVNLQSGSLARLRPSVVRALARLIREHGIDVVHCQRHKPTVYGTLAAWLAGPQVRVISTVRGRERTRNTRRRLLNRLLFRRVARITAVSEAVRRDILASNPGLSGDKVVTLYNGIDVHRFAAPAIDRAEARRRLGLAADGFAFGKVARLKPVKAHEVLFRAFAGVSRDCPQARLVLAGQGPLEEELRAQVRSLGLQERIVFLGQRDDVHLILPALDAFVLASRSEGHPMALLEAMAAGLPCIATSVGGVPEIILGDHQGLVVAPGSDAELAAAMLRLCRLDRAALEAMGRAAQDRVAATFSLDAMVDAVVRLYREVHTAP